MKLNWSFLIKTALTITLFGSATLSAQGKQANNYAQNPSNESYSEVIAALAGDSDESKQVVASSDQEFSSRQNLSGEFALAILLIMVCQLVQCRGQSQSSKQAKSSELNQDEHRPLALGMGLGYFYRRINKIVIKEAIKNSNEKVEEVEVREKMSLTSTLS